MWKAKKPSRGFTLVELLAVIAIIGMLVGLLLPAVQAARDAARLFECANKMRQMGLATLHFESVKGKYPSGRYCNMPPGTGQTSPPYGYTRYSPGDAKSPRYQILPFMEEQRVYDAASLSTNAMVRGFICPSVTPPGKDSRRTCYLFSTGDEPSTADAGLLRRGLISAGLAWSNYSENAMYVPFYRKSREILDGLSKTVFLAERCYSTAGDKMDVRFGVSSVNANNALSTTTFDNCVNATNGSTFSTASTTGQFVGEDWASEDTGHISFCTMLPPNSPTCGFASNGRFHVGPTPSSLHSADGVNTVFGDGAVRFVTSMIDAGGVSSTNWSSYRGTRGSLAGLSNPVSPYGVWGALGTINGGDQGSISP